MQPMILLAQAAQDPQAFRPWWHLLLENPLGLTILIIFLAAIIAILVQERKRDKCLKFFRDFHVTYLDAKGRIIWGDLKVFSSGLSLLFDAPFITRRGLIKTSAMIYESEMTDCIALCRLEGALTEQEKLARQKQIRRSFRPGLIRRLFRALRNAFNTLRDAFSKALSTLLGTIFKSKPIGGALAGQQSDLEKIGSTPDRYCRKRLRAHPRAVGRQACHPAAKDPSAAGCHSHPIARLPGGLYRGVPSRVQH
jgi:hypothetical protein